VVHPPKRIGVGIPKPARFFSEETRSDSAFALLSFGSRNRARSGFDGLSHPNPSPVPPILQWALMGLKFNIGKVRVEARVGVPRRYRKLCFLHPYSPSPNLPIENYHQAKVLDLVTNYHDSECTRGVVWFGAPRRPERLMPPIFLTDNEQDRPLGGAGGEPRQDPSGASIGNFGPSPTIDIIRGKVLIKDGFLALVSGSIWFTSSSWLTPALLS